MSIGILLENTKRPQTRLSSARVLIILASLTTLRNAHPVNAKATRMRMGKERKQRGRGQYSGWGPTPSFAAAKRSYPSRGLLQRCYKSAYRGKRSPCTRQQAREGSACSL